MAMIRCPECGKEVSNLAETCPNCGYPVAKEIISDDSADEYDVDKGSMLEDWKDDIVYGILSILINIVATLIALRIYAGVGLIFPLILYIISAKIAISYKKVISFIGLLISGFGIASIVLTLLFG